MSPVHAWIRHCCARSARLLVVVGLLCALAFAEARAAHGATHAWVDVDLSTAVAVEINRVRAANDLRELRVAKGLGTAARHHALSMGRLGYFSHSSANGTSPIRRIESFYSATGAIRWAVGEVILWSSRNLSATEVVRRWLESSGHHRQLMNRRWRELGAAAVRVTEGPGMFGGRDGMIVVVDFGVRS